MKAIYLNIDPYLQAVADWLNAGKPGTAPSFDPLPVAVTIPLGETAAIYLEKEWVAEDEEYASDTLTIDGTTVEVTAVMTGEGDALARDVVPGLSALAPSAKYAVVPVTGDAHVHVFINYGGINDDEIDFTVLVRREQASGPVDLVDFTPPADAIAAGTDLKGCTFDGNAIEAASDTGVLSAPAAGG